MIYEVYLRQLTITRSVQRFSRELQTRFFVSTFGFTIINLSTWNTRLFDIMLDVCIKSALHLTSWLTHIGSGEQHHKPNGNDRDCIWSSSYIHSYVVRYGKQDDRDNGKKYKRERVPFYVNNKRVRDFIGCGQ